MAGRYGRDWFDVIRSSGARVASLAGDVVDHAMRAAVAPGRLGTLTDPGMAFSEPRVHLNDLMSRFVEERAEPEAADITGVMPWSRPSSPGIPTTSHR